ncbi:MAG: hypothetical protein ACI8T1_004145 [Verrucomicrobiales bacterium]|jgi:hypothetical protein
MIDIDWKPNDRKLRQFAVASLFGFPLIGYLLTRLLPVFGVAAPTITIMIAAIVGAVVCVLGLIFPKGALPVYIALVALAFPIGLALSFVLLPLIYYGVFTPIALGLKAFGKDPMERSLTAEGRTYWIARKQPSSSAQYYKQY